jgi:hypothetical protein
VPVVLELQVEIRRVRQNSLQLRLWVRLRNQTALPQAGGRRSRPAAANSVRPPRPAWM